MPKEEAGFGKLHHKLMVIDDAIVVAGSLNYTAPASEYNDENIFVLGSPSPLSRARRVARSVSTPVRSSPGTSAPRSSASLLPASPIGPK